MGLGWRDDAPMTMRYRLTANPGSFCVGQDAECEPMTARVPGWRGFGEAQAHCRLPEGGTLAVRLASLGIAGCIWAVVAACPYPLLAREADASPTAPSAGKLQRVNGSGPASTPTFHCGAFVVGCCGACLHRRVRNDGPRGLIRLYFPVLTNGGYDLINFIAIEPVVKDRRGFSELEGSSLDGLQGKRLWTLSVAGVAKAPDQPDSGQMVSTSASGERLLVRARMERSQRCPSEVRCHQSSQAPDEMELSIQRGTHQCAMEYCVLTATMGNKARTRRLG